MPKLKCPYCEATNTRLDSTTVEPETSGRVVAFRIYRCLSCHNAFLREKGKTSKI